MTVRLLCVDVGDADDALAASAVTRAVALSASHDRLLCFGRAAVLAARLDKQEREEREGVWLETSAAWLLNEDRPIDPPSRPQPGPLQARATAIAKPGFDAAGLAVNERLVELAGAFLVMAVPNAQAIDAVDNAHLWLVGASPFRVDTEQRPGRAVISLGGCIASIIVDGGEVKVAPLSLQGADLPKHAFSIGERSRMSVRAS